MRTISAVAVMGLALAAVPCWSQAQPPGSGSSVVGATGPNYVPDPQPRAAPQPAQQATAGNSGQNGGRGGHGGHGGHHHGNGGGSGGGYAGVEGAPS